MKPTIRSGAESPGATVWIWSEKTKAVSASGVMYASHRDQPARKPQNGDSTLLG